MSASIARYLKDFGDPQPAAHLLSEGGFEHDFSGQADTDLLAFDVPEPVDPEVERQRAYDEGYAAAMQEMTERMAAEQEALAVSHREEIEALNRKHETETTDIIVARFREMTDAVSHAVSEQAALVLAPVLSETLLRKAVSDMASVITETIADQEGLVLTVRGPLPLFEILKTALGDEAPRLHHVETPDIDLSVDIGETVLVTRLSAWTASLKKVLG